MSPFFLRKVFISKIIGAVNCVEMRKENPLGKSSKKRNRMDEFVGPSERDA
jgi:hypothetical protein